MFSPLFEYLTISQYIHIYGCLQLRIHNKRNTNILKVENFWSCEIYFSKINISFILLERP